MKKTWHFLLVLLVLSLPTFVLMLRPGFFSTQDFHIFRLIEFDKCIKALQIPCRWAPDAGAGYGEPLFNFYGQLPYVIGEVFHFLTFSKIDSTKIVFILSMVLSAVSMFFLAKKIWQNNLSALVSSIVYLYAPYRAVDVWVRGALPEALSFIFFPLIILEIENYLATKKKKDLLLFSLFIALLVINHNLSVILFAPFLIIWIIFKFIQIKKIKPFLELAIAGLFSALISAFYILPVISETKFIDITSTTLGYFDWRAHFVTLYQLFLSRFWGYGASVWGPNDGLSLSLGQVQWLLPAIIFVLIILKRKITRDALIFFVLCLAGAFCLFLTHNKSTFIWNNLSFMKYIQFPWRFLGVAVFAFALASGLIIKLFTKSTIQSLLALIIVVVAFSLNFAFFRPDIWYSVGDKYYETGQMWDTERFASIGDYWPSLGHQIPNKISDGKYINYFPGWNYKPNKDGLIPSKGAVFSDTPIREIGNLVSLLSIILWIGLFLKNINGRNTT